MKRSRDQTDDLPQSPPTRPAPIAKPTTPLALTLIAQSDRHARPEAASSIPAAAVVPAPAAPTTTVMPMPMDDAPPSPPRSPPPAPGSDPSSSPLMSLSPTLSSAGASIASTPPLSVTTSASTMAPGTTLLGAARSPTDLGMRVQIRNLINQYEHEPPAAARAYAARHVEEQNMGFTGVALRLAAEGLAERYAEEQLQDTEDALKDSVRAIFDEYWSMKPIRTVWLEMAIMAAKEWKAPTLGQLIVTEMNLKGFPYTIDDATLVTRLLAEVNVCIDAGPSAVVPARSLLDVGTQQVITSVPLWRAWIELESRFGSSGSLDKVREQAAKVCPDAIKACDDDDLLHSQSITISRQPSPMVSSSSESTELGDLYSGFVPASQRPRALPAPHSSFDTPTTTNGFHVHGNASMLSTTSTAAPSSIFSSHTSPSAAPPAWSSYITPAPPRPAVKPGLRGLQNLGNTCFMASALQCMSNTPYLIRDYLVPGKWQAEVNLDNPLGMQGAMAHAFADLMAQMWSETSPATAIAPRPFKATIARFAPQFSGYAQHDSQELLGFLLDGLHEDLNRVKKKPYIEAKDADGRPDAEVAAEAWAMHRARNDSIIVDLFQGQYRSQVTCQVCNHHSVTFDPFMVLTLPVPVTAAPRAVKLTAVPLDPTRKPINAVVYVKIDGCIGDLIRVASTALFARASPTAGEDADVTSPAVKAVPKGILVEIWSHRVYKHHREIEPLSEIEPNDELFLYELPADGDLPPGYLPEHVPAAAATASDEDQPARTWVPVLANQFKAAAPRTGSGMYYSTPSDSAMGIPTLVMVPSPYDPKLAREAVVTAMQRWTTFPWKPFREAMAAAKTAQVAAAAAAAVGQDAGESPMAVDTQSVPMDEDEPAETGAAEKAADAISDEAMVEDLVPAPDDLEQFLRVEREPSSGSWRSSPLLAGDLVAPGTILRVIWTAAAADQAFADPPPAYGARPPPPPPPPTNVAVGFHPATAIGGVGPIVPHVAPPSPSFDIFDLSGDKSDSDEVPPASPSTTAADAAAPAPVSWTGRALWLERQSAVPVDIGKPSAADALERARPSTMNLDMCLDAFVAEERLGATDTVYCSKCKEHQEATKKVDLWRLPQVLVVALKRFGQGSRYRREKLDMMIEFPETLDLRERVLGPLGGEGEDEEANPEGVYELYAVSNHYGGIGGGHYTAYAKSLTDAKWYEFDDSRVTPIRPEQVQSSAAYVLFYRRRHVECHIPDPPVTEAEVVDAAKDVAMGEAGSPSSSHEVTSLSQDLEMALDDEEEEGDKAPHEAMAA